MKHQDKTIELRLAKLFSKKSLYALVSGMILSLSAAGAVNSGIPMSSEAGSASRIIREQVRFPSLAAYQVQDEKVNVVFTVNESGRVNLVIANTANEALRRHIEAQFLTLSLRQLKANNVYSIQFNFKTL